MSEVKVVPVQDAKTRKQFIRLPWSIYRGDPNWVPPLLMDMHDRMNTKKNPFFEHARAAFFLALRDGRAVGRISACVDENYLSYRKDRAGQFGFFECEDDPEAAAALLETAEGWIRSRGMEAAYGPAAYGGNDDNYGVLIEGFDSPAVIMYAYNPPYYEKLILEAGYAQVKELWAYRMDATQPAPEQVVLYANHLLENEKVTIRNGDPARWKEDLSFYLEIYNEAWANNWGFVPMTEKEFHHHAALLRHVIDRDLLMFAFVDGKPAGAALTIPNLNEALIRCNGRLFPVGAVRLLWMLKARRIPSCRVFTLGVKREFRRMGIAALFYVKTLEAARRLGYKWGDMGWILEDNDNMNRAIELMGGTIHRRWRLYRKELA